MVYIARDGRVYENRPWSIDRLLGLFIGFFAFILGFFKSLFEPLRALNNNYGTHRGSGGGGGGGGGGSGGGGGGGPPRPPQRRIGRITTVSDCTIPGGGCSSCG